MLKEPAPQQYQFEIVNYPCHYNDHLFTGLPFIAASYLDLIGLSTIMLQCPVMVVALQFDNEITCGNCFMASDIHLYALSEAYCMPR